MLAVDHHLARFYREQSGYEPIIRGRFSRGLGCYRTRTGGSGVYAETAYADLVRETRQNPQPARAAARKQAPARTKVTQMHGLLYREPDETWDALMLETDAVAEGPTEPAEPQSRLHAAMRSYLESCGWFWVADQRAFGHPTSSRAYDTVNAFKLQVEKELGRRLSFSSRR